MPVGGWRTDDYFSRISLVRTVRAKTIVVLVVWMLGVVLALHLSAPAEAACSKSGSEPDSGTLTLKYVGPDAKHSNRNDYRLSGTVRWNTQTRLDCFSKGHIDWAYENDLKYQQHFDRAIWNPDFSAFPAAAGPYVDTSVGDIGDITDLTFGLFRPETLRGGTSYAFAYTIILPKNPGRGYHSFVLTGQVLNKQCSKAGPWCVGLDQKGEGQLFIGSQRRFSITGSTCWAWHKGQSPAPCPSSSGPSGGSSGSGEAGSGSGNGSSTSGASVSLAQGPAGPQGYRYGVTLSGFGSNSAVPITCYDTVSPGGFYSFSLATDGAGNASTSSYCYSGDGPDHWVVAGGVESNHVSWGGGSAPPPPPLQTWLEQETPNHPVNTFTNYHNASGMGPAIAAGQWVEVSCKVYDPTIASVNPDGYWYRIASAPWSNAYYSPANTFMNGDPYGGPYTHNTDFAVSNC
jgi:hypothetical protein